MPLISPVPLEPLASLGPVHFIAVGGAGMSGIAESYAAAGVPVSGSDRDDSETLAELSAAGVRTFVGHDADQLGDAETVVVSSAIKADNPELAAARSRGLRVWHRSAALAAFNPQKRLVQPDEVANAAVWLCLPASAAMNGQAIAVAGGEVT